MKNSRLASAKIVISKRIKRSIQITAMTFSFMGLLLSNAACTTGRAMTSVMCRQNCQSQVGKDYDQLQDCLDRCESVKDHRNY